MSVNLCAGIIITPVKNEIFLNGNEEHNSFYTVENDFDSPVDINITAKNMDNSCENTDSDIKHWLTVSENTIKLKPNEKREIQYSVKSGNLKGSVCGVLSFTAKSSELKGINFVTSVPVYMTVNGTQIIKFSVDNVGLAALKNQSANGNDAIAVNYSIKNNGNVHVRPKGSIKILRGKKTVFEQDIYEQSTVYANATRDFTENIDTLPKGSYTINLIIDTFDIKSEKNIKFKVSKSGDITH